MKPCLFSLLALAVFCLVTADDLFASRCDTLKDPETEARCFYSKKRYPDALYIMHSVIKEDSSSFDKSRLYLMLLIQCDDKPGLKKFLPGFQKRFARFEEGAILCARGYGQAGEWENAVSLLEKAYGQNKRLEYLIELLSISMLAEKWDYAGSMVETILQNDSTYAEAYYDAGRISMNKSIIRKIKERKDQEAILRDALGYFKKAAHFDSLNFRYFAEIGDVYKKLGVWDSTCLAYMKAVHLNGKNFKLLFDLGTILISLKKYNDGLAIYEKAFALDPMSVDLLLKIENVHRIRGTYSDYYLTGQERLANALPDTLSIRYNLAVEYSKRNMPEKAKAAYLKVLSRESSFQEANRGIAAIYLLQDSCRVAIPYLEKQAVLSHGEYGDWLNLAQCYLKQADTVKAIQAYEKVLMINPNHGQTAYFLGTWYYNLKQYDKCLAALKDGPSYPDSNGLFRMRGGSLFYQKGDPSKAIQCLLKCVGTHEDDEMLHYMLANLYEQTGDKKKAVNEYKKCLKMSPSGPNVDYYKSRIKELD